MDHFVFLNTIGRSIISAHKLIGLSKIKISDKIPDKFQFSVVNLFEILILIGTVISRQYLPNVKLTEKIFPPSNFEAIERLIYSNLFTSFTAFVYADQTETRIISF